MIRPRMLLLSLFSVAVPPFVSAQVPSDCYRVETLATPAGIAPEVTAVTVARDGRIVACFRRGSIWSLETATGEWRQFAGGLFFPLGIIEGESGEFFVAQIPELTRIADTDGDGRADLYETVCDDWGLSGNYHEFVAGPVRAGDGSFYIGLGCASSGGELRPPFRGARSSRPRKGEVYGHHSPVPYRGWIVKVSPDGELTPVATGARQPNGLGFNLDGDLFAVDNQGDWVGTSPLHHVTPGAFLGHPAGLVWDPDFPGHPQDAPPEKINAMRKPPAVLFPQNDLAGSIAQPLCDTTGGKFGPYAGQFLVAEWSYARLLRVALEKVGGEYQGACFSFIESKDLRRGSNRLAFAPDGTLYIAQVSRLWGGTGEGLQRVVWTGKVPMDILTMSLTESGFELTFTKPVDRSTARDASRYSLRHYYYESSPKYGSPKLGETPAQITAVAVSDDGRKVALTLRQLLAGRIYDLRPRGIKSRDGQDLVTRLAAYTVNRLRGAVR